MYICIYFCKHYTILYSVHISVGEPESEAGIQAFLEGAEAGKKEL